MSKIFRENAISFVGIDKRYCGWTFFLVLSFLFCYVKVFSALIKVWWNNDVYSHGFLIPLISLYLIWIKRDKLKNIPLSANSKTGFSILLCALSMLLIGHVGEVILIQEYSIIVSIVGIVLIIFGIKYLQALFFPIMYLFFMIPFARIFTDGFHYPFQLLSAKIAITILNLVGIPSIRIANNIELPDITLEIAKGCSGVNYFISILAIAIPLTYLTQKFWTRRLILILGAVIVAILSNGLRVALIGILSCIGINADLHGPYHVLQAMFVYIIGLSFLFMGVWILSDSKPRFAVPSMTKTITSFSPISKTIWQTSKIRNSLFIMTIIFMIVGIYINFYKPTQIQLKRDLKYFPYEIGQWRGIDSDPVYETFRLLGVDYDISRTYSIPDGKEIKLYIGYYMYQEQGKELVNYKSEWLHDNASKYTIILHSNDAIRVNRVIKKDGYKNRLIVYWYNLNGRIITDKLEVKMYTAFDAIFKHRTNGTFIMITLDLLNYVDINEALRYSEMFLKDTFPIMKKFII